MARTWTQVKAERHALGCTDPARVDRLKQEMLDEVEVDRVSTMRDVCGDLDETNASDVDG